MYTTTGIKMQHVRYTIWVMGDVTLDIASHTLNPAVQRPMVQLRGIGLPESMVLDTRAVKFVQ